MINTKMIDRYYIDSLTFYKMNKEKRNSLIDSFTNRLLLQQEILFALLFGSFKDYNEAVGFRDIDVALYVVNTDDPLDYALTVAAELSIAYRLPFECIPLNSAPLFLRYRIFRSGIVLFCKDEIKMTDLMEKTSLHALDFMYVRDKAIRELD